MPEGATVSFAICDAYRYFAGQALLMASQSGLRTEYLIPTKKCNLNDRLWYDFLIIW